jgi:hypothetical protein
VARRGVRVGGIVVIVCLAVFGAACAKHSSALPAEPAADQPPDPCHLLTADQIAAATGESVVGPRSSPLANTGHRECDWASGGKQVLGLDVSTKASIAALDCTCTPVSDRGSHQAVPGLGDSATITSTSLPSTVLTVGVGTTTVDLTLWKASDAQVVTSAETLGRDIVHALASPPKASP